eukprot:TRINITY_DN6222_c0_g4_i1.p1 TRINITY_DN6222_c0_g4~~TRINITY_DN6222_c0_g4_i1.p1  ORF type:complete len:812 (-),score=191.97 TRINITY_DN6222_c0_g4_i1:61-2496(-)
MHLAVNSLKITGGSLRLKTPRDGMATARLSGHGMSPLTISGTQQITLRLDLIEKICSFLELRGLKCEGIFRISGNTAEVQDLYSKFPLLTEEVDLYGKDPFDVAAALKLYFRQQAQPLIPFEKFNAFIDAVSTTEDDDTKFAILLSLVESLPPNNRAILRRLIYLLNEIQKLYEVNKMTAENLGVCWGPTLMRPEVEDIHSLSRSNYQNAVFSILIAKADKFLSAIPEVRSPYRIFGAPPPLSDEDWNLLLATANIELYQQDEIILEQDMENYNLYRILTGSVRIEKNNKVVGVLSPLELFGEMSFLGRYTVSARAVAENANVKLQVIESSYIQKILSLHPTLFKKFYWNLTYNMAKRQQARERDETIRPGFKPKKKQYLKANNIVKVTMKDGTVRSVTITDGTTALGLVKIIAKKERISHSEKYKIYEYSYDMEHPRQVTDEVVLSQRLATTLKDPSYGLYFSTSTPTVSKHQTPIKEYQGVKIKEKIGNLFVMHNCLTFHVKLLGLDKKKVYFFKEFTVGDINNERLTITSYVAKVPKITVLTFRRIDDCKEAAGVITWAWEKDNTRRKGNKLGQSFKASNESLSGDGQSPRKQYTRAIAVKPYVPKKAGELALKDNDLVIVTDKLEDWWIGECNNMSGKFPPDCVAELVEAKPTEKLINEGYRDLKDLPSRTDWKLILMGGETRRFQKDQVILKKNDRYQSLYQIVSGRCRVEAEDPLTKATQVIRIVDTYDIFGDIGFVTGDGATANVVSDEDDTEVYVIAADYLYHIFKRDPILVGRFYKYLAVVQEGRLREKQPKQEEGAAITLE